MHPGKMSHRAKKLKITQADIAAEIRAVRKANETVVIDTKRDGSAYLGGRLETIIVAWIEGKFVLTVSNQIVNEYINVLSRPKFEIARAELDDFAALILSKRVCRARRKYRVVEADPSDNKFLEAAVTGQADYIISGISICGFERISRHCILTPSAFLEQLLR